MLRHLLIAFAFFATLGFLGTAFAADEIQDPVIAPDVDKVLVWVTLVMTFLTGLGQVLPGEWKFTQFIRGLTTNLKGVFRLLTKGGPTLLVLLLLPACSFFESRIPVIVECSPDREYLIDNLEQVLNGEDPAKVLDRVKVEKGREFVQCALRRYLSQALTLAQSKAQEAAEQYLLTGE